MKLANALPTLGVCSWFLMPLSAVAGSSRPADETMFLANDFPEMTSAMWPDAEAMSLAQEAVLNHRYDLALSHYREAVGFGNVHAMRIAGMMMLFGESFYGGQVTGNRNEGIRLLRQAAGMGCGISKHVLAHLHENSRPGRFESGLVC